MIELKDANEDPASIVAQLEDRAELLHTPCGVGNMVWRRWGSGPRLVVLLHGAHGSWSHWFRNISSLADQYTVLAADLPGLGDSAEPPMPTTGDALADIIAEGIISILPPGASLVHLIGFSFGGGLGGLVAVRLANRLTSLTLVCPGGLNMPPVGLLGTKGWRQLTDEAEVLKVHRYNLAAMMIANPNAIDDLAVYLQNHNTRRSRLNSKPIAREGVLLKALPEIKVPVNAIWGEQDLGDQERQNLLESMLRGPKPNLTIQVIPGAGHWVAYEAADHFNSMLMTLLSSHERV